MNFQHVLPSALLTSAALAALAVAAPAQAQTVRGARTTTLQPVGTGKIAPVTNDTTTTTTAATSPVGFITTTCLANTDTNLTIPFTRPPVYVGASSANATNTSSSTGTIPFAGTPFTASAYKYVQGTQSNHYYAYVTGGPKEGAIYDITDNSANTLTINTNGDVISGIASGTQVRIVPHWTLATAFTLGQSIVGTASLGDAPTYVLLPDQTTPGTDLLPPLAYYYYTGNAAGGAGWRSLQLAASQKCDDTVLYPETFFVLRNSTGSSLTFVPVGSVSTLATAVTSNGVQTTGVNIATVLNTLAPNTDQDNSVGLPSPVDVTLTGSRLYESGAFTGLNSFGGDGDQLLVYDNSVSGTDKLPTRTYYYYTGTAAGGAGWRRLDDAASAIHNNDVLKAGAGFVVRKRGSSTVQSVIWNYRPTYAP